MCLVSQHRYLLAVIRKFENFKKRHEFQVFESNEEILQNIKAK